MNGFQHKNQNEYEKDAVKSQIYLNMWILWIAYAIPRTHTHTNTHSQYIILSVSLILLWLFQLHASVNGNEITTENTKQNKTTTKMCWKITVIFLFDSHFTKVYLNFINQIWPERRPRFSHIPFGRLRTYTQTHAYLRLAAKTAPLCAFACVHCTHTQLIQKIWYERCENCSLNYSVFCQFPLYIYRIFALEMCCILWRMPREIEIIVLKISYENTTPLLLRFHSQSAWVVLLFSLIAL